MKSAAPFTSITDPTAVRRRKQVDPDEVAAERLGRSDGEHSASGGGTIGIRPAPSATFVRHSPGFAWRETAPTTQPPGDEQAQVVTARRHELLQDAARRVKPDTPPRVLDRVGELPRRVAAHDVASPAPGPRLQHDRGLKLRPREPRRDVHRSGVRDAGGEERVRGRELVVRPRETRAVVQHDHTAPLKRLQRPPAGLDAVERGQHVEPAERHVAGAKAGDRLPRCQHDSEPSVGRRGAGGDDREDGHLREYRGQRAAPEGPLPARRPSATASSHPRCGLRREHRIAGRRRAPSPGGARSVREEPEPDERHREERPTSSRWSGARFRRTRLTGAHPSRRRSSR